MWSAGVVDRRDKTRPPLPDAIPRDRRQVYRTRSQWRKQDRCDQNHLVSHRLKRSSPSLGYQVAPEPSRDHRRQRHARCQTPPARSLANRGFSGATRQQSTDFRQTNVKSRSPGPGLRFGRSPGFGRVTTRAPRFHRNCRRQRGFARPQRGTAAPGATSPVKGGADRGFTAPSRGTSYGSASSTDALFSDYSRKE
jgi:hypothetical protein